MYQEVKLKVTLENISKLKNPQNVQDIHQQLQT